MLKSERRTHPLKCVVVGDGAVGKTSLITTYATNRFPDFDPTPSIQSIQTVFGNKTIDLALWDTTSRDDYDRLRPLAYPETDVFLICFSVSSPTSYANVCQVAPRGGPPLPNVPTLLVGTKTDLRRDEDHDDDERTTQRLIRAEQGEQLAKDIGAFMYAECAAKTQEGLQNLFHEAIRVALNPACNNGKTGLGNKETKTCSLF